MLGAFFWIATGLGFIVGLFHAVHIISSQWSLPGNNAKAMAAYRAIWAVALWTVFGSYLLALWIIGFVLKAVASRTKAPA